MAKFCTNCGNQLEENAAMCLKCGCLVVEGNISGNDLNASSNEKKKKGLPTWAIILIIVGSVLLVPLIIFIVVIVFTFNSMNNIIDDVKDNVENIIESKESVGTIGDTLKSDDISITLNDALMYTSIGDDVFANTPAEGNEYLVFFFEVENLDDKSIYISSFDFDGYVDGSSVSPKFLYDDIDGYSEISSAIAKGEKNTGYVAYEVDKDWENFEIRYREFDLDIEDIDGSFIFKVINSNN